MAGTKVELVLGSVLSASLTDDPWVGIAAAAAANITNTVMRFNDY